MSAERAPNLKDLKAVAGRPAREGLWKRTAYDTRRVGLSFGFLAAESTAAAICAGVGAFVVASPDASTSEQVLVAVASGIAGFLGILAISAIWSFLRAPFRQRN